MARATSKKVIFELYWSRPVIAAINFQGEQTPTKFGDPVINIRVRRSSDITFDNQQGYRDKAAALDTIRGHVEQIGDMLLEELVTRGRIKITGPGKKPS